MSEYIYHILFDNGDSVIFKSTVDIDLHKIGVTQYGAGSLAFDDMFINLQHVVSIDKKIKEAKENTPVIKGCATCKYEGNQIPEEPCYSCIHGLCDENLNRTEKWEAKE